MTAHAATAAAVSNAPMLRVQHLHKAFGDNLVLDDFNLEVGEGEFVSLIGPSGCGKTTALRIVAGLLGQTSGDIVVANKPSVGPSRDKAIVFQHFNLFPWRVARSNAEYGLEIQGMPADERHRIADQYLQLLGLSDAAHLYPSQLSGGQRQRVGIARALAIQPKLLLMDEPFGALDALTREHLQGMLLRICDERRLTVLFVTHSIDEAIYLSDRIVCMGVKPGRIIEEFTVGLPRPRTGYDFRVRPEYTTIRSRIWSLLQQQLELATG